MNLYKIKTALLRLFLRALSRLRRFCFIVVSVKDKSCTVRYACNNEMDLFRVLTLWEKEPGTMLWIDESVGVGDTFLDIGANIGIYSIAAAMRVGQSGKVYAIEPNKINTTSLHRNVKYNSLDSVVKVLAVPVASGLSVAEFNYMSLESAMTGAQFGSRLVNGREKEFRPAMSELMVGVSVDYLVESGAISSPHLVKIDVDGLELEILRGMKEVLKSTHRPRAVQVELNVGLQTEIEEQMREFGYVLMRRHLTKHGQLLVSQGLSLDRIAHNAVFTPA